MEEFSKLSLDITKSLNKTEKKTYGIFFTPNTIVTSLVKDILKIRQSFENTLEPSCGSCQFIDYLDSLRICKNIDGVEYNSNIFNKIKDKRFKNSNVSLVNENFLEYETKASYDLIIGNPPYFFCKKEQVNIQYLKYITGRPNIFCLFILHSLSLLKENGLLAFVIPNSFLNSSYYNKIRQYIVDNFFVESIVNYEEKNDFIDTEQSTIGIIISNTKKDPKQNKYVINVKDNVYFTYNYEELNGIFKDCTTIKDLGLSVKTGTVVWNQRKDELTDDETKTLLVYNSNIKNNKLVLTSFSNEEKKQYIEEEGLKGPVIAVNRGNGNSKYKLSYCLIDINKPFLLENHVNFIYSSKPNKTNLYQKIIKSFEDPRTKLFIELFIGNGGLSKTELETIFPIFL